MKSGSFSTRLHTHFLMCSIQLSPSSVPLQLSSSLGPKSLGNAALSLVLFSTTGRRITWSWSYRGDRGEHNWTPKSSALSSWEGPPIYVLSLGSLLNILFHGLWEFMGRRRKETFAPKGASIHSQIQKFLLIYYMSIVASVRLLLTLIDGQ